MAARAANFTIFTPQYVIKATAVFIDKNWMPLMATIGVFIMILAIVVYYMYKDYVDFPIGRMSKVGKTTFRDSLRAALKSKFRKKR
jgi:hypothetical protein